MSERITVNSKKSVSIKENLISHRQKTDFQSNSSPVNRILYLQRTIGNQAVQRMVRSGALQAKLRIGQPGDVYEQEADRVADAVMRMPDSQIRSKEDTPKILRKRSIANSPEVHPDIKSDINTQRGSGQPLPDHTRAFFEPRFGYDFGGVRIHPDAQADKFNRVLGARAFTLNQDIYISNMMPT